MLFLDEIGNMALPAQAKLLRVLQDRTFRRVGVSEEDLTADIQLICATNVEPETLIRQGKLREDIYDRVAAVTISTPPLRDCMSDLTELAKHFLRELGLVGKKRLSRPALHAMKEHSWPGNMRELRRVVQEAVVRSEQSAEITLEHLPPSVAKKARQMATRSTGSAIDEVALPDDSTEWPRERLLAELQIAVAAKRRIQAYKGSQWKAEFMRLLYPNCKAANAKGFEDLIKRLTKGPWGDPDLTTDDRASSLLNLLRQ